MEGQVVSSTEREGDAPEELVQVLDNLALTRSFQNMHVDAWVVVHCSALATLSVHASTGQQIGTDQ